MYTAMIDFSYNDKIDVFLVNILMAKEKKLIGNSVHFYLVLSAESSSIRIFLELLTNFIVCSILEAVGLFPKLQENLSIRRKKDYI